MKKFNLNKLDYHYKLLMTFFLTLLLIAIIGSVILVNTSLFQNSLDLPTLKKVEIKYAYSPFRRAIHTSMRKHISDESQFRTLDQWAFEDGPYYNYYKDIDPILRTNCIQCHGGHSTQASISLLYWGDFAPLIQEKGIPAKKLLSSTHYHLLGISLIILITSGFLLSTSYPSKLRLSLGLIPFFALIIDVSSWWLCKVSDNFAILILIFGILLVGVLTTNCILIIINLWRNN